ncbi:hypothetical protein TRFO_26761 [Tritrichomonas foetus]|uniref:PAS domain-containing protein n=1 Tax=Tritrichomonas foetus TaxID=1144522 RepID=A0A1J4K3D8_9EUKA|nr:hypothetical protein TRFO_26761 [Tritrichomonas foetus]|eukprot:OHT05490.1 hypothetical protein TRFO_26761 [Tritrichomonas foetus]
MMKGRTFKSSKMVPLSPIMSYFVSLSDFFILGKHSCLLPYLIYRIVGYWQLLVTVFALLLCGSDQIWSSNPYLHNVFTFFQVFWRFGSQFTSTNDFFISFIVIVAISIIGFVPTLVGHIIWKFFDKFHASLFYVITFMHEILLVILHLWVPSQMASVITKVANDSEYNNVFHIIQIIVYFVLIISHILFSCYFVACDMIYMRGRSLTWNYKFRVIQIIITDLTLFFTRLVETLPRSQSIIVAILTAIVYIFYIALIIERFMFVSKNINILYASLLIGFFIGFILQCISIYVVQIDLMIVIVVNAVASVIAFFSMSVFTRRRIQYSMKIMNMIENDESLFAQLISSPWNFLRICRICFQNGHRYIFTWNPFNMAVQRWPNNKSIIIQYIKFVAVYFDEDSKLASILHLLKTYRDFSTAQLRREIKLIRESRDIHLTRTLKLKLKNVDERVKLTNNLVVSFWNAIEDNNPNSTFDISYKLSKVVEHVHADFVHYSTISPNNWVIPSQYATFLLNIVCDPEEGQYWSRRARFLRGKKSMLYDAAQTHGFDFFPNIPRAIDVPHQETPDVLTTQSVSTSCSSGSSIDFDKNSDANEIDDIDITPSGILKMGERAQISFVFWPFFITCLFFAIAFVAVPFTPVGMYRSMTGQINDIYSALIGVADVSHGLPVIGYLLMERALQIENILPSNDEISDIINFTVGGGLIMLDEQIELLNDNIHAIQKEFTSLLRLHTKSWDFIQTTVIPIFVESEKGLKYFNSSFLESMNIVAGAAYKYNIHDISHLISESYFRFYTTNFEQLPVLLNELVNLMSLDINSIIDDFISTVDVAFYIFGALEVIILPVFIFLAFRIRKQWKNIVSVFNSIPRVAIHKAIQDHTNNMIKENNVTNRSEFRYLSTFSQMVISRDTTSGVPVTMIICFGLFNFIVSIASCFIFDMVLRSYQESIKSLPMTYFYSSDYSTKLFTFAELLIRMIAAKSGTPYYNDTVESLDSHYYNYSLEIKSAIGKIMTTTWNEMQVGFVVTSEEVVNHFFEFRGSWFEEQNEFLRLQRVPRFFALNILSSLIRDTYSLILTQSTEEILTSQTTWTRIKCITDHLMQDLLGEALKQEYESMNITLKKVELFLGLISALMLIIGALTISLVIYKLYQVRLAVRFALSSLSMIDHHVIQDMPSIMNLFSGKVTRVFESNRTLQSTYVTVDEVIPESVLQLDTTLSIVTMNNEFAKQLGIEPEMFVGTHIDSLLSFSDKKIISTIQKQAESECSITDDDELTFEAEMTIKPTKQKSMVNFTSIRFNRVIENASSSQTRIILFFKKSNDRAQNIQNIEGMLNSMTEMKSSVIPEKLRNRINITTNKTRFMPRYIVALSVNIINYNDFCSKHTPKESKVYFRKFQNFIKEQASLDGKDIVVLKVIGTTVIIGFNLDVQIANYYSAVYDAIGLVKTIHEFSHQEGYETRFSIVLIKKSVLKLSTRGTFRLDLYTKKVRLMMKLLFKGTKDTLMLGPKVKDLLPEEIKTELKPVKFIDENKKAKYSHLYNLSAHS